MEMAYSRVEIVRSIRTIGQTDQLSPCATFNFEIHLKLNDGYYDCLNVLLDIKYLRNLFLLKVNWIHQRQIVSNIHKWLSADTILKWKSTPIYGYCDQSYLIVCLWQALFVLSLHFNVGWHWWLFCLFLYFKYNKLYWSFLSSEVTHNILNFVSLSVPWFFLS